VRVKLRLLSAWRCSHLHQYILATVFMAWPLVVILSGWVFLDFTASACFHCFITSFLLSDFLAYFILLYVLLFPSWLSLLNEEKATTAQKEQLWGQKDPSGGSTGLYFSTKFNTCLSWFPKVSSDPYPSRDSPRSKFICSSSLSYLPGPQPQWQFINNSDSWARP
jgi:hypothetical protein